MYKVEIIERAYNDDTYITNNLNFIFNTLEEAIEFSKTILTISKYCIEIKQIESY